MTLEERLLYIAEDPFGLCDKNSLRKIALEVRKMEDRIKQLETDNDSMRADLLLWGDNLRLQQRINRLEEENDAMRADLLLWREDKWRA